MRPTPLTAATMADRDYAAYESNSWCSDGEASAGKEWTLRAGYQIILYREDNCCICAKGPDATELAA